MVTGNCLTYCYVCIICMYLCIIVYNVQNISFIFKIADKDSVDGFVPIDILVALHACDTARDEAIYCGVRTGAAVIVTAPCCQKEVRAQMDTFLSTKNIEL